jgi:hypothetical protein
MRRADYRADREGNMSEKADVISRQRATEIYYAALARAASVRIETEGVTRAVPLRMEEEAAALLGDEPTELFAYLFRRGYKAGWKSQVGFNAVWDYCGSVWPDTVGRS